MKKPREAIYRNHQDGENQLRLRNFAFEGESKGKYLAILKFCGWSGHQSAEKTWLCLPLCIERENFHIVEYLLGVQKCNLEMRIGSL